jgi:hypothetical protein
MEPATLKYTNIFHCKAIKKVTQILIFGLKTNRLATLLRTPKK